MAATLPLFQDALLLRKRYDLFISHVTQDIQFTGGLVDKLRAAGFEPFYADSGSIPDSSDWKTVLRQATNLETLKAAVVVVHDAPTFLRSKYAVQEVNSLAAREDLPLYIVLLCSTTDLRKARDECSSSEAKQAADRMLDRQCIVLRVSEFGNYDRLAEQVVLRVGIDFGRANFNVQRHLVRPFNTINSSITINAKLLSSQAIEASIQPRSGGDLLLQLKISDSNTLFIPLDWILPRLTDKDRTWRERIRGVCLGLVRKGGHSLSPTRILRTFPLLPGSREGCAFELEIEYRLHYTRGNQLLFGLHALFGCGVLCCLLGPGPDVYEIHRFVVTAVYPNDRRYILGAYLSEGSPARFSALLTTLSSSRYRGDIG